MHQACSPPEGRQTQTVDQGDAGRRESRSHGVRQRRSYRRQSVNRGTGTGMKVITQTIQLLNSYNRQSIVMTISNVPVEDGETGCEVRFTIPLHYSYRLTK